MVHTLEPPETFGAVRADPQAQAHPRIERWLELAAVLNALNRNMGLDMHSPFRLVTEPEGNTKSHKANRHMVTCVAQNTIMVVPDLYTASGT